MLINTRIIALLFLNLFFIQFIEAQGPQNRAVQVSATVQEDPPKINFSWPWDWSSGGYAIFKKHPDDSSWGEMIDSLPWGAEEWVDEDVEVGIPYEYAFIKKGWETFRDTFVVESGSDLTFSIHNIHGNGICCNYGTGWYEVIVCDELVGTGGDFGLEEAFSFPVCGAQGEMKEVIITVFPDLFPKNMYWTLTETESGVEVGSSPPVGSIQIEHSKYGYIYTGINLPAIEERGKILLLIDETYQEELSTEIETLKLDFIKDGWRTFEHFVDREEEVPNVKSMIQEIKSDHPDLNAVMILGHVPVPYSGALYPDGHIENHWGAWPADCFYADLDGVWTDESVNNTTAFLDANHNIPGDGKYDQSILPSPLELQIGRVDLFDMPAFQMNDIELLRNYLSKSHAFKTGAVEVQRRGLIDDNINQVLGSPAATAWRNFSQFFGADNVVEGDYFSDMGDESYLWSYGSGGGTHFSANGIGHTFDFAIDSLQTVFTMMLGSQFGDWDNSNNFLRAPLAQGLTLTNCWAGNPPWTLHHMAMGYHIGYSTLRTQNASINDYHPGPQMVHVSLLGDPTLRMHPVIPPTGLQIDTVENYVQLIWEPASENEVLGYHVYRSDTITGVFQRINTEIINESYFVDELPLIGSNVYLVKTVKLESSGSGTYQNLSLGIIDSVFYEEPIINNIQELELIDVNIFPNPSNGEINIEIEGRNFSKVDIRILDLNGRMIARFKNNLKNSVTFLPKGVYIIEGRADQFRFLKSWVKI